MTQRARASKAFRSVFSVIPGAFPGRSLGGESVEETTNTIYWRVRVKRGDYRGESLRGVEPGPRPARPHGRAVVVAILLLAPLLLAATPLVERALATSRAPNVIATTLAFDNGIVVTVQYSQIYFCNSAGPATSSSSSPCAVGQEAAVDPVPDTASSKLEVIVPAFLHPLCGILGIPCSAGSVFDASLGGNNFAQCPDNTLTLTCPNHPDFLDLGPTGLGVGVVPLPIHSHIISGQGTTNAQGGWWQLRVWLVLDPRIWPNPVTGACPAGSGCLTSEAALMGAGPAVVGPVPTTVYLFFNVVGPSAQ